MGALGHQAGAQLPAVQLPGGDPLLDAHAGGMAGGLAHAHAGGDDAGGAQGMELSGIAAAGHQEVLALSKVYIAVFQLSGTIINPALPITVPLA